MIFETHAHYDDARFAEDLPQVLDACREKGVRVLVNIGSDVKSLPACIRLSETYPQMYCALGVHPTETAELSEEVFADLEQMLTHEKAVAVGEIGLDYYWDTPARDIQQYWFIRQLELAEKTGKPVVIHSREAAEDTFRILTEHYHGKGVIHCYSYSPETAREYVKRGYYLGIGGVVTYKNAKRLPEVVAETPLTALLLETDSPYLAPQPFRGKRNDSSFLPLVAERIAEIKGISREEVEEVTFRNAVDFYFNGVCPAHLAEEEKP